MLCLVEDRLHHVLCAHGFDQQPQQPALGNGEMIAMNFSPYPGGTGALLEHVVKERGAAAFARHVPKPTPLAASDKLPATDEESWSTSL